MTGSIVCTLGVGSDVGAARREGQRLAEAAGFHESDAGRVGLAVTELATNLVRHGGGGRLLLQPIAGQARPTIEILSVDSGPGMQDAAACLRDGYSQGGTAGTGLGAIKRLSHLFDLYTAPGKGCIVLSRIQTTGGVDEQPRPRWRCGAISTPVAGETAIGDCWRIRASEDSVSVMVADGLGHGPLAAEASDEAARIFERTGLGQAKAFFAAAHGAMRSTRGAAVAVATFSLTGTGLQYAGVGNICGVLLNGAAATRGLVSHNGTVGAEMRSVQEFSYEWSRHDRLVMHSDGIMTRWDLASYAGLLDRHPAVIAAVLHRDFQRGRDDATVVVMDRVA